MTYDLLSFLDFMENLARENGFGNKIMRVMQCKKSAGVPEVE